MAGEQAIVSRLSALEELSGMEVLCTDKTGTLTVNILTLDRADIAAWDNYEVEDVLLLASLSVNWENQVCQVNVLPALCNNNPEKRNSFAPFKFTRSFDWKFSAFRHRMQLIEQ